MKKGRTEAETLRLNHFGVGDVLRGDEGFGYGYIVITAIGEENFLCRWLYNGGVWSSESGHTTLSCRNWEKVCNIKDFVIPEEILKAG